MDNMKGNNEYFVLVPFGILLLAAFGSIPMSTHLLNQSSNQSYYVAFITGNGIIITGSPLNATAISYINSQEKCVLAAGNALLVCPENQTSQELVVSAIQR